MQGVFVFFPIIALIAAGPSTSATHHHNRRVLHHPLFPVDSPAPTLPPNNNATRHLPPPPSAHPLSSTPAGSTTGDVTPAAPSAATADTNPQNPFFPTYPTPPPPPDNSGTTAALPTFPANISSLVVPGARSASSHSSSSSSKLIAVAVVLCIVAASLIASLAFLRHRHRLDHRPSFKPPPPLLPAHSDSLLYPPHSPTSDAGPPKTLPRPGVPTTSSEFIYLGTMTCSSSREFEPHRTTHIDSPEIRPLPPLPPLPKQSHIRVSDSDGTDDEEFYSPTVSSERIESFKSSSSKRGSEALGRVEGFRPGTSNFPDSSSSSPRNSPRSEPSVLLNSGSVSSSSVSPEYIMRPPPIIHRTQPPPPLPSPPPSTGRRTLSEPPVLPQPTRSLVGFKSGEQLQPQSRTHDGNQRNDEPRKPKFNGLHRDKVRASSDGVMVWGRLDHGSFALNEEMTDTLFTRNASTMGEKDLSRRAMVPMMNQGYRVLDPNKSQNIAILLRSLNVSVEEVCDSLLEGNADMLGTELLESLLKMTPTDEEERKLRSYKDESPLKLGPAEKLLKAVLGIPFAFERVDAMLYMANFDSEVDHLHRSFRTIELASEELRSSRMFLKLLEAVLERGNRVSVGMNQGDAQAFKLDTLLKLVDVKGTDGKTTLLHFAVQEIMKAEGSRLSVPEAANFHCDMETKRHGLQVVAGLCGELTNVKKAAAMNSDAIASDFHKLVTGIVKVQEVAKLNIEVGSPDESNRARFADSISEFEKKARGEIMKIQAEESSSLSKVKELTGYFHGDTVQEGAHPFRIFALVRDFLSVLDQVCKEVTKANERTMISSARQFAAPVNPVLPAPITDDDNGEKRNGGGPPPVEDSGFF